MTVDQFIYLFVIVAAMLFGWFIYQRNHNDGTSSTHVPPARKRKQHPRKKH